MPFELEIALRYLLAKRRQVFISVISLVSIAGVTVGVMALVIALALMTGLQQELRDRMLGSSAHVFVFKSGGIADYRVEIDKLATVPGVVAGAPAIIGRALITGPRGEGFLSVKGIDPALERNVTDIGRAVTDGSFDALAEETASPSSTGSETTEASATGGPTRPTSPSSPPAPLPGILIGHELAGSIGAAVGDTVTLLSPQATLSPLGAFPRQRRLRVVGIFRLGLFEFDQAYGFVSLATAGRLAGHTEADHLELKVADIYQAPAIADRIAHEWGSAYLAQDWADLNRPLYSALWLEKIGMGIGIGLIVGVAALNIVASLVLLVMEKTRDIAILKTMGASARSVMLVFLLQGVIIGAVGTVTGAAAGVAISAVMDRYRVISIPSDVYQVTYLPFKVLPWDLVTVILGALVVCFVATLYPSRQAARLDPAQALRYE